MRRLIAIPLVLLLVVMAAPARAQVQGGGTLKGKAYFDLSLGLTEDVNNEMFTYGFRRIYLTYNLEMSENITGRFRTDVEQKTDGYYRVYMKHAYVNWKAADMVSLRFGQQGTILFGTIEDIWGYRQVLKTLEDNYKVRSSADFGMSARFSLTDMITVTAMHSNGNGYNKYDDTASYAKATELQGVITPIDGLTVTAHYGMVGYDPDSDPDTDIINANTMDVGVGYAGDAFSVGGSFFSAGNWGGTEDLSASGFWGFGTFAIPNSPLTAVATYQSFDPDVDTDDDTQTTMLIGLDFSPGSGLSIIPNYLSTKSGTADPVDTFRITFYWKW